MSDLIKAVRDYASEHYDKDGWDYVVEAYEDADIAEVIGKVRSPEAAIARMRKVVKIKDEYRSENKPMKGWDY